MNAEDKRAILFCRVSSEEQATKFSLDSQVRIGKEYAAKHKLSILEIISVDESGYEKGGKRRTEFDRMLGLIKSKGLKNLLVLNDERLLRDARDYVSIKDLLEKDNLTVHWTGTGKTLNKDDGDEMFLFLIKVAVAEKFIRDLKEKTKRGVLQKRLSGEYVGKTPLGYKLDETDKLIVDEERVPIVEFLFSEYAKGQKSLKALAEEVWARGWRSRDGKKFFPTTLSHLLKNVIYIGKIKINGDIMDGNHPALIDRGLFDKVQARLKSLDRHWTNALKFFFKGKCRCGICGGKIVFERHKSKENGYTVYGRCWNPKCRDKGKYIREQKFFESWHDAYKMVSGPRFMERMLKLKKAFQQTLKTEQSETRNQSQAILKQIEKEQKKLETVYNDKLEGRIPKGVCEKAMAGIEERIGQLKAKLAEAQADSKEIVKGGIDLITLAVGLCMGGHGDKCIDLLENLVDRAIVKGDKIEWIFKEPFKSALQLENQSVKGP